MSLLSLRHNKRLMRFGLLALYLAIVLIVVFKVALRHPPASLHECNPDEGIELMKALLVSLGYEPYSQIWSDHPPLFTFYLSSILELCGTNLFAMRMATALLGGLLAAALFHLLRLRSGWLAALFSVPLAMQSHLLIELAGRVMAGLPAAALATAALAALVHAHDRGATWAMVLSAAFLVGGVLTKFIAISVFVPVFFELVLNRYRIGWNWVRLVRQLLLYGGISGTLLLIFAAVLSPQLFSSGGTQLLLPHLSAPPGLGPIGWDGIRIEIQHDWPLTALMPAGVLLSFLRGKLYALLPLVWFGAAVALLSGHTPFWYHHYFSLSVPLVWLVAIGLSEPIQLLASSKSRRNRWLWAPLVICLGCTGWGLSVLPERFERLAGPDTACPEINLMVLEKLRANSADTNWVLTDRPMYAWLIDKPVPPLTAVFSRKRLRSDLLNLEMIRSTITEYRPEQILLQRFPDVAQELAPFFESDYVVNLRNGNYQLFLRRDLVTTPAASQD